MFPPSSRNPQIILATVVFCAAVGPLASPHAVFARESQRPVLEIRATLKGDFDTIEGTLCFPGGYRPHTLYLYPNRFRTLDEDLNDVNVGTRFPRAPSTGKMSVEGHSDVRFLPLSELQTDPTRTCVPFKTRFPHRFGVFGSSYGKVTALDGWYPIPLDANGNRIAHTLRLTITVPWPGWVVTGNRLRRTKPGQQMTSVHLRHNPGLLAYRPDATLQSHESSAGPIDLLISRSQHRWKEVSRYLVVARQSNTLRKGTLLILEAPLREVLAVPFPGGLLVSDRIYEVTPARTLKGRHESALDAALRAESLLLGGGFDLYEATLAAALELEASQKLSRERSLRAWFRKGEILAAIDEIGTDTQSGFENTLFFLPRVPKGLTRTVAWDLAPRFHPRAVAHQLLLSAGPEGILALVERWHRGATFEEGLETTLDEEPLKLARMWMHTTGGNLKLVADDCGSTNCPPRVCSDGFPRLFFLEIRQGNVHTTLRCEGACCPTDANLTGSGRTQLDPAERIPQVQARQDPRRDDRDFPDLKWMLARPFFTMTSGDSIPTAGFEVVVQPRYDLKHQWYISPFINPNRFIGFLGWRIGLGRKVRPNALVSSLSLSLRAAIGLDASDRATLGPAISYYHSTAGSRMNPWNGTRWFVYGYPLVPTEFDNFGVRFGGMFAGYLGPSPRHIFAFTMRTDATVGWRPGWERTFVGGDSGVRGLSTNTLDVALRLGANLEYRWLFARFRHRSLARLGYLTGLQGAFFFDLAFGANDWDRWFSQEALVVGGGTGLRLHLDTLGFIPAMIRTDVGVIAPVGWSNNWGWAVTLGFVQPF